MKIGVPKEIKPNESRVGLMPASVRELTHRGHSVAIESGAGLGAGFSDEQYTSAGADIVESAEAIFSDAEMVVKVKEPQPQECKMLRENQLLFTYLHLAPDPKQTELLQQSGCTAIAYETITNDNGGLPLLAPMSEVAGRLATQVGAYALQKNNGGRGMLLGGVPGVQPAKVAVIGGGVVGLNAARMALGLGADVTIFDTSLNRLAYLDDVFGPRLKTQYSSLDALEQAYQSADLVIGAVLIPGAAAPKLLRKEHLKTMLDGSVIVDVAIDQGGCFETSKATTHQEPTYVIDGVVHYCVANMPGAVPRTSTRALNHATLPFAIRLAQLGWQKACAQDKHLLNGLNVSSGKITCKPVADALGFDYTEASDLL